MPKSPVSRGKRSVPSPSIPAEGMGRSIQNRPNMPESKAMAAAQILFWMLRSFRTIAEITKSSTAVVNVSSWSANPCSIRNWMGIARISADEAPTALPTAAARTARIPCPFIKSLCPGSTVSISSGSGAPMKTDGTKSTKEWTTAADMMHEETMIGTFDEDVNDTMKDSIAGYDTSISEARVFTWIPGVNPVKVPIREPDIHAKITNSISSRPTTGKNHIHNLKVRTTVRLRIGHNDGSVPHRDIQHPLDLDAQTFAQRFPSGTFAEDH